MEVGLKAVTDVMTSCMTMITGNELLMALFCTCLVGAGFGLIGRAKGSVLS